MKINAKFRDSVYKGQIKGGDINMDIEVGIELNQLVKNLNRLLETLITKVQEAK